jgi:ATP-dependent DNA helicase RecG
MNFKTPIKNLFMVGPTYARRLEKLEIRTAEDLLYHFPHRYQDFSLITPIAKLQPDEKVTIQGRIESIQNHYTRTRKQIQKAIVVDPSGQIEAIWFNQPFLVKALAPGVKVSLSGQTDPSKLIKTLISPEYEILKSDKVSKFQSFKTIHTGRLVPVYPETYGVSSKWLRSRIAPLIKNLAPNFKEFLPLSILEKYHLPKLAQALTQIHFPASPEKATEARNRFAFEELFLMHLATKIRKKAWQKKKLAFKFKIDKKRIKNFITSLPFELTNAQKRATKEILADLAKNKPMNRLLEGDVGSGKTVVAAIAILASYLNGFQSALMAPTEILANQHFQSLKGFLQPFGLKVSLLTGATRQKQAEFDLIVGTHSLIHKRASFKKLGLITIDEQQRFGVKQRAALIKKSNQKASPHFLTMTATPIPRTIALTLYGDLDLSVIDELPPGRTKIKTWVVPSQKRAAAYNWIKEKIKKGDQAFIICPLIEESASETLASVKAAKSEFESLKTKAFKGLRLGLLHGRLKSKEKEKALQKFQKGRTGILVATPVVEVGIDIQNATIMMIEAADRFGLAQLHQLRGRVGRGKKQSYCLLFSQKSAPSSLRRLKSMEKDLSGAELAEVDLRLRGPGELYGARQHGFLKLKIASFQDLALVSKTGQEAEKIITRLNQHLPLKKKLEDNTIADIEPN